LPALPLGWPKGYRDMQSDAPYGLPGNLTSSHRTPSPTWRSMSEPPVVQGQSPPIRPGGEGKHSRSSSGMLTAHAGASVGGCHGWLVTRRAPLAKGWPGQRSDT
jgi:hypothetical protein